MNKMRHELSRSVWCIATAISAAYGAVFFFDRFQKCLGLRVPAEVDDIAIDAGSAPTPFLAFLEAKALSWSLLGKDDHGYQHGEPG